jgi:NTE family protein
MPDSAVPGPRVLLALSGGGARGLAAIGVLEAFEEKGIKVHGIGGTSMGGIVGGLYACGYPASELAGLVADISFSGLFANSPERGTMFQTRREDRGHHLLNVRFDGLSPYIPQGYTAGQTLVALFSELTAKANYKAGGDFSRLSVPFLTVSTDIVSGRLEVIRQGSLAEALRATMAFPLAFTGVDRDGKLLMDGGMIAPIPVEQVRLLSDSISYVVAVNTTSPLVSRDELNTPVDIANQVTSIMTADQLAVQLAQANYVTAPDLNGFAGASFDDRQEIINRGYQAGLTAADSIIAYFSTRPPESPIELSEVVVGGMDRSTCDRIHARLLGKVTSRPLLLRELGSIYNELSLFSLNGVVEQLAPQTASVNNESIVTHNPQQMRLTVQLIPRRRADQTTLLFVGNSILPDSVLANAMGLPEEAWSSEQLRHGIDRVLERYYEAGYDFANVRNVVLTSGGDTVFVSIDEAVVKRIDVNNNSRSRDWLIRSYFPLSPGEPYSTRAAAEGIDNVYGTDLYDRVSIALVPHGDGAIVEIDVVEKLYTQVRFGWHWVDFYGSEEFVEVMDDNLFGIGLSAQAHAGLGRDRWNYFVRAKLDRIFFTYFTVQTDAFYQRVDRPIFDGEGEHLGEREEERFGSRFQIGQQMGRLGTVTGGLTIGEVRWHDEVEDTRRRLGMRSINLGSRVENLDREGFPTVGHRLALDVQLTGKVFGGDEEFTRWYALYEVFHSLGPQLTYHPRLTVGSSRTGLPPTEKFYMGGIKSFSGYRRDELSGDKMFLFNQEVRLQLPLRFYVSAHYDVGEVYSSTDQIKLKDLRYGGGGVISWDTPLGPFEFGYGRSVKKIDQYYFRAGLYF